MSQIEPAERQPQNATPRTAISRSRRDFLLARQGGLCAGCREPLPSAQMPSGVDGVPGWTMTGPFEIDHVLPLELGGGIDLDNLQALCVPCHKAKTREDIKRIRKAARLRRDADPETRRKSPHRLRSRGFQKDPLR